MSAAERQPAATSSIGAVWPPQPASNNRLKGFYPEVVENMDGLNDFERSFWESHEGEGRAFDRTTVRFVGSSAILGAALERDMLVEAAMPLAGDANLHMVYVGANTGERQIEPRYLAQHQEVLRKSRQAVLQPSVHAAMPSDIHTFRGSEAAANDMHGRFMELYATFGFSENDVAQLLANPDNVIAYLQNTKGEVLSTCLAEQGVIDLGRVSLSLYEITEAVTRPDVRGQGYYTAVSGSLGRAVVGLLAPADAARGKAVAVYGESNLSSPGVIYSGRRNGRVVVADSMPYTSRQVPVHWGILQQNYKVNDGADPREYNDFALTYLPIE